MVLLRCESMLSLFLGMWMARCCWWLLGMPYCISGRVNVVHEVPRSKFFQTALLDT